MTSLEQRQSHVVQWLSWETDIAEQGPGHCLGTFNFAFAKQQDVQKSAKKCKKSSGCVALRKDREAA